MSPAFSRFLCAAALAVLSAGVCDAAIISVPATGNLQSAIDKASPGDVIELAAGAIYTGNFVLPEKTNPTGAFIVITTAPSTALPGANVRVVPSQHAQHLAKLRSPNTEPALRTAPRARFWRIQLLEFLPTDRGFGDIIALGSGDPQVQTSLAQVPGDLVIDRCYIHGDAGFGQKRGIALNSGATSILNSYISDIKAVGSETQAIAGWNGPGPYTIENTYLAAAGIGFLIGGSDPGIQNLVPTGITFKRNHVTRPLTWRGPALATPANVNITIGSSGALRSTNYYTIVAAGMAAMDTPMFSRPTQEVSVTIPKVGSAALTWNAVPGATKYRVYRSNRANSPREYFETTTPSFVDTGGKPPSRGTIPGAASWAVKNLFELKSARNVVIDGNVLENNWTDAQSGYAVLFTVRNQDGGAPWSTVDTVAFTNNIVRHSPGGINILGRDDLHPSGVTRNVTIRNNLFDDLTPAWGNSLPWVLLGDGPENVTLDHNTVVHKGSSLLLLYGTPTKGFVFTNNMGRQNEYGIIGDSRAPGNDSINTYLPGAVFAKNLIVGGSAASYPSTNAACGTAGASCYPTETVWQAQFVNFNAGNYRLLTSSVYAKAGTTGADLGANIAALPTSAVISASLALPAILFHALP